VRGLILPRWPKNAFARPEEVPLFHAHPQERHWARDAGVGSLDRYGQQAREVFFAADPYVALSYGCGAYRGNAWFVTTFLRPDARILDLEDTTSPDYKLLMRFSRRYRGHLKRTIYTTHNFWEAWPPELMWLQEQGFDGVANVSDYHGWPTPEGDYLDAWHPSLLLVNLGAIDTHRTKVIEIDCNALHLPAFPYWPENK